MFSRMLMLIASLMIVLSVYLLLDQEPLVLSAQGVSASRAEGLHNAQTATVEFGGALGFVYSPKDLRISPGDSVEWLGDFGMHPLVSDDGLWQVISGGTTFTHTFDQPGTYDYHCLTHSFQGMRGTVTVGYFGYLPLIQR